MDGMDVVVGFWSILAVWVAAAFAGAYLTRFIDPIVRAFGREKVRREPAE